jgi:carboxyl-terminal processing protease
VVKVNRFFQRFVFVASSVLFATVVLGFIAGEFGWLGVRATSEQDGSYKQINVFEDVLQRIQSDYVTEPNMKNVNSGALHGLLESLDVDSSYLSPAEYKIYKDHLAEGSAQVGLIVSKRYGYAAVVTVLPGSPADKEKIVDGDVIESIDGESTRDLSVAMIRNLLSGKPGSTVTISVVRSQKPEGDKITLTRTAVADPAFSEQQISDVDALYLKPGEITAERVNQIAEKIKTEGKGRKLILDLRDTAIGDEAEGVHLANLFIKQGTIATLAGQKFPTQTFTADPSKTITDSPLIVLVNRGTYGAAELTAAAIGDLKRGDVLGERTFGEGTVQKTLELPDGAVLFLTVAKYATPEGKKIEDDAVTPTMIVGISDEEAEADNSNAKKPDEILAKAVELLKTRSSGQASTQPATSAPVKN